MQKSLPLQKGKDHGQELGTESKHFSLEPAESEGGGGGVRQIAENIGRAEERREKNTAAAREQKDVRAGCLAYRQPDAAPVGN